MRAAPAGGKRERWRYFRGEWSSDLSGFSMIPGVPGKRVAKWIISGLVLLAAFFVFFYGHRQKGYCLTGAFLADKPSAAAIDTFKNDYGKKPFFILVFLDWGKFPDDAMVRDIYGKGSVLMVTWEPWDAESKEGIDPQRLLQGHYDGYIRAFAAKLKEAGGPVFLRFAHEMNGDWYPWSGQKIGPATYQKMFRHVHEIFGRVRAKNVRWVFSINAEDVPPENRYSLCYPGDRFVDYIGLDGYNWGTAKPWGGWRSFKEIFSPIYHDTWRRYQKPVIISEFSSTSAGGDKARWIEEALREIPKMPAVKGFVLFNLDKETDWRFSPHDACGRELKKGLRASYFLENPKGDL